MGKEGNLDGVVRTVLLPAGSTVGWAWEKQQRISYDRCIICFFGLFRFILLTYNSCLTLMWNRWSSRKIQTVQISWENLNWQHHDRQGVVLLQYKSHGKIWTLGQAGGWKDCFAEWWLGTDTMPMVGDLTRISTAWTCAMSLTRLPLKSLFLRWWIFSAGLFFCSDLNLSDILERCEAFWVPRSTVRVQGRRLCQDFQRDG